MRRIISTILTVAAVTVLSAGAAFAGPKEAAGKTCALGVGKPVCCKTYVADHCGYVSCCEVGNAGFFTQKLCSTCEARAEHRALTAAACATAKDPMAGNAHFFTASAACDPVAACGDRVASGAKSAAGSCCGAAKGK